MDEAGLPWDGRSGRPGRKSSILANSWYNPSHAFPDSVYCLDRGLTR